MRLWLVVSLMVAVLASRGSGAVSTIVTGLWDIKRGAMESGFRRSFEYYLEHFRVLLQTETNLIIFGSKELGLFVQKHRQRPNYIFIERELAWFEGMWHNPLIQRVRKRYKETRADWDQIKAKPEFALYLYNTVVMTKLFLMRQALQYDQWNSDFFLWQDGGINHSFFDFTANEAVVSPANMGEQIAYMFPWPHNFHFYIPFKYKEDPQVIIRCPAWANYYNLYIQMVTDFAGAYENHLRINLEEYDMTTDEGVFTKMHTRMPYLMPMVNSIKEEMINHRFEASSYYQQRARAVRRFSFGRGFERATGQRPSLSGERASAAPGEESSECGRLGRQWLTRHNLAYAKAKVLKYSGVLCLMLLLLLKAKVKSSNDKQIAYFPIEQGPYDQQEL